MRRIQDGVDEQPELDFKEALSWFVDTMKARYGGNGVLSGRAYSSDVLECMDQWLESMQHC